jgi:hypothetical protein
VIDVVIAQSLVEYGALSSLVDGFQSSLYSFQEWLGGVSLTTWLVIAVVGVIVLRLWNGRK